MKSNFIKILIYTMIFQVSLNCFGATWSVGSIENIYGVSGTNLTKRFTKKIDMTEIVIFGKGPIEAGDSKRFHEILQKNSSLNISTLMVTNLGGDTAETLEIAETMQKNKMNIFVRGYCWSACAAHLLVAAEIKYLDGIVGLHGNPLALMDFSLLPNDISLEYREILINFKKDFVSSGRERRERLLLEKSGVSQKPFDLAQIGIENFSAIVMSPEAMMRYGFKNIVLLVDNYSDAARMIEISWDERLYVLH